jgi:hypothetical protein
VVFSSSHTPMEHNAQPSLEAIGMDFDSRVAAASSFRGIYCLHFQGMICVCLYYHIDSRRRTAVFTAILSFNDLKGFWEPG